MRKRILELNQKQAKELGISKSTLNYLRKNAKKEKCFRVYEKVAALPIVMKAQSDLEKLAGIADLKIEVESSQAEIEAKLLRMFTDLLMKFPPDLREKLVEALPDDFKLQRDSDDKDGTTEIQ